MTSTSTKYPHYRPTCHTKKKVNPLSHFNGWNITILALGTNFLSDLDGAQAGRWDRVDIRYFLGHGVLHIFTGVA